MSQGNIEVRGYTAFNNRASRPVKILAFLVDICFIIFIGALFLDFLKIFPYPSFTVLSFFFGLGALYWLPQRILLGITGGERCWRLKTRTDLQTSTEIDKRIRFRGKLYQTDFFTPTHVFVSGLLTTLAVLISFSTLQKTVLSHPLWLDALDWKLEAFIPDPKESNFIPFYYSLGGWPLKFNEKPIFFSVPYEKGPPTQFLGQVTANWDSPDILIIIEGPKTPTSAGNRETIRNCILQLNSLHCLSLRRNVLSRPLEEAQNLSPYHGTLKWFHVDNPAIPPEDQPQGIYLSTTSANEIRDRFILINAQGTHQTLTLKRPKSALGETAFELFQKTIRSLRVFSELNSGRAWVNREIESIHLGQLQSLKNPNDLTYELARIQSLLLSRISVDPRSFDSFFHLAGTALMLTKSSVNQLSGQNKIGLENLQSAFRYAQDVAPHEPRLAQIQGMLNEYYK